MSVHEKIATKVKAPAVDLPVEKTLQVDFAFLREVEGFRTDFYVPKKDGKVIGQSGVTVFSGLDLGQQNERGLKAMGLSTEFIEKARPYLGLTKEQATKKLEETGGFTFDQAIAEKENTKVKKYYAKKVAEVYDKDSNVKFKDLTPEQQTVVTSVLFQYGYTNPSDKKKGVPNFWKQVTSQDWAGALNNLKNFGDLYTTRRGKEAELLGKSIDKASDFHVVKKGSNLTQIAKKYGITVKKLKQLNGLKGDQIKAGQKLLVK